VDSNATETLKEETPPGGVSRREVAGDEFEGKERVMLSKKMSEW
jgi:hypothetical protein